MIFLSLGVSGGRQLGKLPNSAIRPSDPVYLYLNSILTGGWHSIAEVGNFHHHDVCHGGHHAPQNPLGKRPGRATKNRRAQTRALLDSSPKHGSHPTCDPGSSRHSPTNFAGFCIASPNRQDRRTNGQPAHQISRAPGTSVQIPDLNLDKL